VVIEKEKGDISIATEEKNKKPEEKIKNQRKQHNGIKPLKVREITGGRKNGGGCLGYFIGPPNQ